MVSIADRVMQTRAASTLLPWPMHVEVREDEDFVVVLCTTCGDRSVFSALAATLEALFAAAHAHTCHEEHR